MEKYIVENTYSAMAIQAMSLQSVVNKVVRMGRSLLANNKNVQYITYRIVDVEGNILRTVMMNKFKRKVQTVVI